MDKSGKRSPTRDNKETKRSPEHIELDSGQVGIYLKQGAQIPIPSTELDFLRSREVPYDWGSIFGLGDKKDQAYEIPKSSLVHLREEFESSWGFTKTPTVAELKALPGPRLFALDPNLPFLAYGLGPSVLKKPVKPGNVQVSLTRYYAVAPRLGKTISLQDFDTPQGYESFWESVGVVSFPEKDDTDAFNTPQPLPIVEYLDLSSDLILEKFRKLDASKVLTTQLADAAAELLKVKPGDGLSLEQVNQILEQFTAMTQPKRDVTRKILELQLAAKQLGYILALDDMKVKSAKDPNDPNKEVTLKRGDLFVSGTETATLHIRYAPITINVTKNPPFINDGRASVRIEGTETPTEIKAEPLDELVTSDVSRIEFAKSRLKDPENLTAVSYIFDFDGVNYVTDKGELLDVLMDQCHSDDTVRSKTAVWIPVFSQLIGRKRRRVGYVIVKAPLKGMMPVRLPALYVDEDATLRLSWKGTGIGELLTTAALGPGEERSVSLELSLSRAIEETRSIQDVLDTEESFASEFTSELEKEAKFTTDLSTSANWSVGAQASGSFFGLFSGGASASGGQTWTKSTEEFYRSLLKQGAKASASTTRKLRREISASTTTKLESRQVERTEFKLNNINEGRTLSVFLYRVYNNFLQYPYLRDLKLVALPSVPIIEGLGLKMVKAYSRQNLGSAILDLELPTPPFKPLKSPEEARARYWDSWLLALAKLVCDEYTQNGPKISWSDLIPTACDIAQQSTTAKPDDVAKTLKDLTNALSEAKFDANETRGLTSEIVVGSPALYADCVVGSMAGTEPYSETMRNREIRNRDAAITESLSKAMLQAAQARKLGGASLTQVVEASGSDNLMKITIKTSSEPRTGKWELFVDGERIDVIDVDMKMSKAKTIEHNFAAAQKWLSGYDTNLVVMNHQATMESIVFTI